MDRFIRIFNKEFSKIGEAAIVLAFFTLLSQILAIFRDRFLAGNIGASKYLDIYYASFRVPDLLLTLGASLVSVSILMPFFTRQLQKSTDDAKKFINQIFTIFFGFIVISSIILFILMPFIIHRLFPGFNNNAIIYTIKLSRIMLLSPILLGVSNLFATITQSFKRFFVYALTPVFYNIGIIFGILFFYPSFGVVGLSYGVILGAFLHLSIQLPVILSKGFFPKISFDIDWKNMKKVIINSLPRTITLSLSKIVFLIFVSIGSTLLVGTISVFNLSYNLQSVPLAIIGVSYSVAAFPILVDSFNSKDRVKFLSHVMGPIRQIIFWSLPVISIFVVLRAQIVRVILGTGNFSWSDTRLTAASLAIFILSVLAQGIILLLVRAYYAAGKTWKPFWITLFTSSITVLLAFIFLYLFNNYYHIQLFFESLLRIRGVDGSSVIMLSFAYSVGMFLNLLILWNFFKKDFDYKNENFRIKHSFLQSFSASLIIGTIAYIVLNITDNLFSKTTTIGVFLHGLIAGIIAILIGILYLFSIKNKEIGIFIRIIKNKLWKKNNIVGKISNNL